METLTERNLDLEEKVRELRETVGDLVRASRMEPGLRERLLGSTVPAGESVMRLVSLAKGVGGLAWDALAIRCSVAVPPLGSHE